jgi:hypothetical protein
MTLNATAQISTKRRSRAGGHRTGPDDYKQLSSDFSGNVRIVLADLAKRINSVFFPFFKRAGK